MEHAPWRGSGSRFPWRQPGSARRVPRVPDVVDRRNHSSRARGHTATTGSSCSAERPGALGSERHLAIGCDGTTLDRRQTRGGPPMAHSIVVYESVWGNTAAVAEAIAEGLETRAFATDAVPADELAGADLIVAGSPVFGFSLPTERMRKSILHGESDGPPPDLSHPSLRSWLDSLPLSQGRCAAFETRIWWSPRGATGTIEKRLSARGYSPIAKAEKFVVRDKYGPLRDGELDRAREWGRSLREATAPKLSDARPEEQGWQS